MNCRHCAATLIAHEGTKAGFAHCNGCGCCFAADGSLRPGTAACRDHANEPAIEAGPVAEQVSRDDIVPVPLEISQGTGEPKRGRARTRKDAEA